MKLLLRLFCLFITVIPLQAESINVAAASDLSFALQEIVQQFEHDTGIQVHLTLGSSGNFFAQILNGAPFDVFLSADMDYPRELEKKGYAAPGSTFIYGIGHIALWVPNRSPLAREKPGKLDQLGMRAVLDDSVRKIAIANPAHAPYGRAAVAALEQARVYDRVKGKLVLGENVSQAAQFVQSGAAEIGIIAMSLALSKPMRETGQNWMIPAEMYPPLEQGAVLLNRAGPAGKNFYQWLRRPEAKKVFRNYGFVTN